MAFRYWRGRASNGTAHSPDFNWLSCIKFKLKDTYGGVDRANGLVGAAAFASGTYADGFHNPPNAYDGSAATFWTTDAVAPPVGGHWLGCDLGVAYDIVEIEWQVRSDGVAAFPNEISVEACNDWNGVAGTWVTQWTAKNLVWSVGQNQVLTNDPTKVFSRVTTADALVALNYPSPEERISGAYVLVAPTAYAIGTRVSSADGLVAATSSMPMRITEAAVLVAILFGAETHRLRAWTFTQDDHDFYVLGLGSAGTLVLDLLTNQWSMWSTEGRDNWRTSTGIDWDNYNIAGDLDEGIIWNIAAQGVDITDPGRTDDFSSDPSERRPIISVIRGLLPIRLRNSLGCYRAVLSVSEGAPVAAGVGITLRTSDDFARSWHNHGTLLLDDPNANYDIQWSSLGQIVAPGRIFEIEDTGYAVRIDALDVDLGPDEGKVDSGG
jgi:hypothetical protein